MLPSFLRRRKPQPQPLSDDDLALIEAAGKGRLRYNASTEQAYLLTDSDELAPVDVSALRVGPLVIHDAIDYTLPQQARGWVQFRPTLAGEQALSSRR